jgi:hypothetical protein
MGLAGCHFLADGGFLNVDATMARRNDWDGFQNRLQADRFPHKFMGIRYSPEAIHFHHWSFPRNVRTFTLLARTFWGIIP